MTSNKQTSRNYEAGDAFTVPYPFWKNVHPPSVFNEKETVEWHQGIMWDNSKACSQAPDSEPVAHAMGDRVLTIIKVVDLGKEYQKRIIYQTAWRLPNKEWHRPTKLKMIGVGGFSSLLNGYRHEFYLKDDEGKVYDQWCTWDHCLASEQAERDKISNGR